MRAAHIVIATAVAALVVIAAKSPTTASAHTVTTRTCSQVASLYPSRLRGQMRTTCVRLSAKHVYDHKVQRCRHLHGSIARNICIVKLVFGKWGGEAVRVTECESTWSTHAQNGQYKGLFQMGSSERARYGHGPTALEQSKAAYRYFAASGYDWSPWECKP